MKNKLITKFRTFNKIKAVKNLPFFLALMLTSIFSTNLNLAMNEDSLSKTDSPHSNSVKQESFIYKMYEGTEIFDSKEKLGKYLIATKDIPKGTIVAKFEGPITEDSIHRHSKWIGRTKEGKDQFIIVKSSAVYVNHSCNPNSEVREDMSVITTRDVKNSEALTISYNNAKYFPQNLQWDPEWNFDCYCNSENCLKKITGFIKQ